MTLSLIEPIQHPITGEATSRVLLTHFEDMDAHKANPLERVGMVRGLWEGVPMVISREMIKEIN